MSVIIPAFNVQDYIEDCLHSVFDQTLDDIEIIVTNDGSTDRTGNILARLCGEDNRLTVITQENKGLSVARNVAMSKADGEFFMFVDSDDSLADKDALRILYDTAVRENADMVVFGWENAANGVVTGTTSLNATNSFNISQDNYRYVFEEYVLRREFRKAVWNKFYRATFINSGDIKFISTSVIMTEDIIFNVKVLSLLPRITILPDAMYRHNWREGSLSRQKTYANVLERNINTISYITQTLDDSLLRQAADLKAYYYIECLTTIATLERQFNRCSFRELKIILYEFFDRTEQIRTKAYSSPSHVMSHLCGRVKCLFYRSMYQMIKRNLKIGAVLLLIADNLRRKIN
ncbi:MAG: glycosyltransferase [Clostridiales bacterium]|nr:glycosyltransferase [Clostridiales bacterium]